MRVSMLTHSTKNLSTGFVGFVETEQLHVAKILIFMFSHVWELLSNKWKKKIKKPFFCKESSICELGDPKKLGKQWVLSTTRKIPGKVLQSFQAKSISQRGVGELLGNCFKWLSVITQWLSIVWRLFVHFLSSIDRIVIAWVRVRCYFHCCHLIAWFRDLSCKNHTMSSSS